MYCSNCGTEAEGNFCWKCGSPLAGAHKLASPTGYAGQKSPPQHDWSAETNYFVLIQQPEVRERIAKCRKMAPREWARLRKIGKVSEAFGEAATTLSGLGSVSSAMDGIGKKLSIDRDRTGHFDAPTGTVIVAALCSLARHGYEIRNVEQLDIGCILRAAASPDAWAGPYSFNADIRSSAHGTDVRASTRAEGIIHDFGICARDLKRFFDDIGSVT